MKKVNAELVKRDQALYTVEASAGFSEKRNKAVIEDTIKRYDAMQRKKFAEAVDTYGERAEAVTYYLKSLIRGKSNNMEKYFGRRTLAALRGEEIRQELLTNLEVRNNQGIIVKRAGQEVPSAPQK